MLSSILSKRILRSGLENMGPEKMDLIFDCVGNEATLDQAINTAREKAQRSSWWACHL